jgi:hypothetical protein
MLRQRFKACYSLNPAPLVLPFLCGWCRSTSRTVLTLLLHCSLFLHCPYTVLTLSLHCSYTALTLLSHFSQTILTLLSHCCVYVVSKHLQDCLYTVLTLFLHCSHTVLSLFGVGGIQAPPGLACARCPGQHTQHHNRRSLTQYPLISNTVSF